MMPSSADINFAQRLQKCTDSFTLDIGALVIL